MIPVVSDDRLRFLADEMDRTHANGWDGAIHNDDVTADIMGAPVLWGIPTRLPVLLYPERMQGEGSLVCGEPALHGEIRVKDVHAGRCIIHRTSFQDGELEPVAFESMLEVAMAGWRID